MTVKSLELIHTASKWAALPRKGWDRLLQRRIVFGSRPQADSNMGRFRNKNPAMLLSTDAMTLVGGGVASGWRPLAWFWCSVAAVVVVGGAVLALLGPPPARAAREQATAQPPADAVALVRAVPPAPKPLMRRVADLPVQPSAPVAEPAPAPAPQPFDQPPRDRATPLAAQASGDAAQKDASPRGHVVMIVHPARAEGAAALAERLAARTGIGPDQVDVGTIGEARSEAAVRFYSEDDHALARRIGRELGGMGYTWKLHNYSQRPGVSKDWAMEVWLPNR